MSIQNSVYPLLKADRPPSLGTSANPKLMQGTAKPGAPVLSPLSGEIVSINYKDWDEVNEPLLEAKVGYLMSLGILTIVNGVRVINVIGPILYLWGSKPQPEVGEKVYRGEELGEVPDLEGATNFTWTVYLNEGKGARQENPVKVAKSFGQLQYYDDTNLLPEQGRMAEPLVAAKQRVAEATKTSRQLTPVAMGLLVLGAVMLLKGVK